MKTLLLAGLSAVLTTIPGLAAPISALTFTGNAVNGTAATTTRGYAFNVTLAGIWATHLSIWDLGGDGLAQSHDVGLWDPIGNLIASANVPTGTAAPILNGFRFVDIPDVALPVGSGYTVGALLLNGSADGQARDLVNPAAAPGISIVGGRFINNGVASLTRPTTPLSNGLVGGSLLVDTLAAPVPEPGSIGLIGLGVAALGYARRRTRAV
jgi:PEP-CTERM motif